MGIPVMVLGESGTGKSTAMRNLDPERTLLIQVVRKPLPFRTAGWKAWDTNKKTGSIVVTDSWEAVMKIMAKAPDYGKDVIVIDDFQYLLANEFMRRSHEKGFEKFTEIGHHAWSVLMAAQESAGNARVYILSHSATDEQGNTKAKTIGKMLDEKITVEGLFTIVLRTSISDKGYGLRTQNSGADTTKSPMGLFEDQIIDNDLAVIDAAITDYYGIEQPTKEKAA